MVFKSFRWISPALGIVIGLVVCTTAFWGCSQEESPPAISETPSQTKRAASPSRRFPDAEYVGGETCAKCHPHEMKMWADSHHDWAMKVPTEETVLANFDNAKFTHKGVTTTFFKRDGQFLVNTEGPDGKLRDYPIKYTFGKTPLQQYLVEFPGGRLQTLATTWDTLNEKWYHLHEEEPIRILPNDELHWTAPSANWNFMCADCHSTDLQKNYDEETDTYATTWKEINVSCEACHGPASEHVKWAEDKAQGQDYQIENFGLVNILAGPEDRKQKMTDETQGTFVKIVDPTNWKQVETCARCHARRSLVSPHYKHSEEMLDNIVPQLLREDLYHADGQIQDEVYVYGSFVQSKMYHHGVRCSDCHNPHSLKLYTPDHTPSNLLCTSCHKSERYDTPKHHHHPTTPFDESKSEMKIPKGVMGLPAPPGPPGTNCVDCHMPTQTYMQVDPRRDHSLRVPRPDLSDQIQAPNACTQCHADKDNAWAANATARWYGSKADAPKHYGQVLYEARQGKAEILPELIALTKDEDKPIIVRATALSLLERFPSQESVNALLAGIQHEDPLMRHSAVDGLMMLPPEQRFSYAVKLLEDPVEVVRTEAVRVLSGVPKPLFNAKQRAVYNAAVKSFKKIQSVNIDRPEANLNMATLYATSGQSELAEKYFRRAVEMNPLVHQARFQLAQYLRQLGRDNEAEPLLRTVIEHHEDFGDAHYDLGLLLATSDRMQEGLQHLKRATELMPNFPRVHYNYSLALNQAGQPDKAIAAMKQAYQLAPTDRDILLALVTLNRDAGHLQEAFAYARQLVQLTQGDPGALQLMQQVQQMMKGDRRSP